MKRYFVAECGKDGEEVDEESIVEIELCVELNKLQQRIKKDINKLCRENSKDKLAFGINKIVARNFKRLEY
jgi:hypothetical protein